MGKPLRPLIAEEVSFGRPGRRVAGVAVIHGKEQTPAQTSQALGQIPSTWTDACLQTLQHVPPGITEPLITQ